MANSLTAIFTSLLALPDLDRNRIAELLQRNDKKPMQTTSLRLRPGTRQLIDELSGKIGVSQSELLNMVIEGSFRDIFLPFSNTAISVIDRFELLMQSHELSPTDIAELLSSWNVRVSVLQDRERTMDYLSTPLLQALADWFFVSPGWLFGSNVPPVDTGSASHQWPQTEEAFREVIIPSTENNNDSIIFWKTENTTEDKDQERNGILIKKKISSSQLTYFPVLSIITRTLNTEQECWKERLLKEHAATGTIRPVTLGAGLATALEHGTTLPVLIFRQL
ncbi:hypothetical protein K9J15_24740 [Enterobacter cloacae]|uniref:hypothetical protein n=1 Tax=Enterobacter cloacae complex TaxID=354276 RepID=UPI000697C592|nr:MULTISPECIES: hypothetical protein [Enterobacter cloacae complex]ELK3458822.1 hypothetical protein [Enterobacter kobei]KTJ29576.1 hypothetical protein ASU88_12270 [Enterobacter hormaechei subsp. xiangfangensis]MCZ9582997.1 hypothetical protein [Enterobacter cloacae]CZX61742.1 Uncharacterised protein [Enterobacter hormaechei]HAS1224758.1 hypothetical protein [Enterobacter cloacae]